MKLEGIKKGDKVLICVEPVINHWGQRYYAKKFYIPAEVERTTKTLVVVCGERFSRDRGNPVDGVNFHSKIASIELVGSFEASSKESIVEYSQKLEKISSYARLLDRESLYDIRDIEIAYLAACKLEEVITLIRQG